MRDVRASAPGRVNLIGEHTDYHDGYVMPSAVPQHTTATLKLRNDRTIRVTSREIADVFAYEVGRERRTGGWGDYVQGVTWVLSQANVALRGFDLRLESDVPIGSGLSSSAALEVAVLRALRIAFELEIDDLQLARAAQRAEVEFVGAPVGIMDQMAASLGIERAALFLDTRSLHFEQIPFPTVLDLVVLNSGIAHQHAVGDYVTRRRQSEAAAQLLGVDRLRDAPADALDRLGRLPDLLARRARHVITENARVVQARAALLDGDVVTLGRLFSASHASLRDDYEVSVPAVDLLVELAEAQTGVHGARMTGGGFGGAIVIAAETGRAADVALTVCAEYQARTGRAATVLVPLGA